MTTWTEHNTAEIKRIEELRDALPEGGSNEANATFALAKAAYGLRNSWRSGKASGNPPDALIARERPGM